ELLEVFRTPKRVLDQGWKPVDTDSAPIHMPTIRFVDSVGHVHVPGVDRVARSRTPVQLRTPTRKRPPQVLAEALTTRDGQDGELGKKRGAMAFFDQRYAAVVRLEVDRTDGSIPELILDDPSETL